jgi:2-oxoisovalerate dehydrogenase E1 component
MSVHQTHSPQDRFGAFLAESSSALDAIVTAPQTELRREVYTALTIRRTEERLLKLFQEGRLFGTVHTCLGQEWTGVAVAKALRPGDFIISNHRCHGHYLAWTDDVEGLIAEVMGKATGVVGGRGGSQHLCRDGFYSNGIQGGMMPVAAGMALARKREGRDAIGTIFVGDGTLGEGALYETLNIISRWSIPLLVVLENNLYAQSTSQEETLAGDILARAAAFGIRTADADTWDWQRLLERTRACADVVRATGTPTFLRIDTYRLAAHSKGDDQRDPAEVAAYAARDPLNQLLSGAPIDPLVRAAVEEIEARIERAVMSADAAPLPAGSALPEVADEQSSWDPLPAFNEERIVQAIRRGLMEAMAADERIVLIGEDIRSPYGGAFKATAGLSDEFPDRVLNAPISEQSIVGVGNGLALAGRRPVVEIMFGDFLLLAADQIVNHAAKFAWMYNEQVTVPLVVRTPMGGGRGYGPTHSQSLEKHLLGLPGTRVLALHHRYSPALLYRSLLDSNDRPTIAIENKIMYGRMTSATPPDGFVVEASRDVFPTVRVRPCEGNAEVTIVAYGGMAFEAEKAALELFDEHELIAEVLMPQQIYPLDLHSIVRSVRATRRLVVVEEGQGFAGFASELIAQLLEREDVPGLRVRRVTAAPQPIPTSRPLEQLALPDAAAIVRAAREALSV